MDYSENKLLTKKNIASLLILAILLLAIPLGVRLAQRTQIFRPRADVVKVTFSSSSDFPNTVNCDASNNCTTTSPTIDIKITAPDTY